MRVTQSLGYFIPDFKQFSICSSNHGRYDMPQNANMRNSCHLFMSHSLFHLAFLFVLQMGHTRLETHPHIKNQRVFLSLQIQRKIQFIPFALRTWVFRPLGNGFGLILLGFSVHITDLNMITSKTSKE